MYEHIQPYNFVYNAEHKFLKCDCLASIIFVTWKFICLINFQHINAYISA